MVILILIDGLRPDTISGNHAPNIAALAARGAYTLRARSVMPSITLPCHMSVFHSVPPERHGVTTNTYVPMARPLPGLFDVARAAGKRCAFFYNWEPLRNISQPGSLAVSYFRDNVETPEGDSVVAAEAARVLAVEQPDFAFIYLGTTDTAGHEHGWMTGGYLNQVSAVDAVLGRLLEELLPKATILLQSDHGGHERTHGTEADDDMLIPWMVAGQGVRAGHELQTPVSLLDTAPTLARLLGVSPHHQWEGRVVEEALVQ